MIAIRFWKDLVGSSPNLSAPFAHYEGLEFDKPTKFIIFVSDFGSPSEVRIHPFGKFERE